MAGALCLLVHGCDASTGGAVELSWKLRPASSSLPDKFVDCAPDDPEGAGWGKIESIRLNWQVTDNSQLIAADHAQWECGLNHSATKFVLPEGTADLSVVPVCERGEPADLRTYIAPAPVQRVVTRGDTVSLGAVELVISVSSCDTDHPCICAPVILR